MKLFPALCLAFLLSPASHAFADRTVNADLRPQFAGDPLRKLPCNELYCLGVDGHLFYRTDGGTRSGNAGFYHGGFWVPVFAEVNPYPMISFNAKVVAYNPAASYGVASDSRVHPFFSASFKENMSRFGLLDVDLYARFFDLDRQTLGAGLTLQEKEMAGLLLSLSKKDFRFIWIFDGTGGYNVGGDLFYYQLDYRDNLIGIHSFTHEMSAKRFYSIYSKHDFAKYWSYGLEASTRNRAIAGLAALAFERKEEKWGLKIKLETRQYGSNYAEDIKQNIQHDYISIEQDDKPFTDSMNIFVKDDAVLASAAHLSGRVRLSRFLDAFSQNEFVNMAFKRLGTKNVFFFRTGLTFCPLATRDVCGSGFLSNKMLTAIANPTYNDTQNKPLFWKATFLGLEARFKF